MLLVSEVLIGITWMSVSVEAGLVVPGLVGPRYEVVTWDLFGLFGALEVNSGFDV
jgi:hypothetical protein